MLTATALAAWTTVAAAAASAAPAEDYFVIDTQFIRAPSSIVDSGGAFAGCTSVRDLGGTAEPTPNGGFTFSGTKRISCAAGSFVLVEYVASTTAGGRRTSGEWWVVDSNLGGATSGGGTVRGDNTACVLRPGSNGCILDTFSGDVS
jgi:hypothetical protein